jgi:hypothetical protein
MLRFGSICAFANVSRYRWATACCRLVRFANVSCYFCAKVWRLPGELVRLQTFVIIIECATARRLPEELVRLQTFVIIIECATARRLLEELVRLQTFVIIIECATDDVYLTNLFVCKRYQIPFEQCYVSKRRLSFGHNVLWYCFHV